MRLPSVPNPLSTWPVDLLRERSSRALFELVAGPGGDQAQQRIHATPGPRWFEDGSPIRRVHGDTSMYVGGVRALLLQMLHPLAMAAVADFSDFRGDPWGRLARTSTFLAETTFGAADDAERAVRIVRAVHRKVQGTAPDGRPYRADDPHLLTWVHVAEVDSFLSAHQTFGARPLSETEADEYITQAGEVALRLGAKDVPGSQAELAATLDRYRPELAVTPAAREASRFLLLQAPVPLLARGPYGVLVSAAVGALPGWARAELGLGALHLLDSSVGRVGGHVAVRGLRWISPTAPVPEPVPVLH